MTVNLSRSPKQELAKSTLRQQHRPPPELSKIVELNERSAFTALLLNLISRLSNCPNLQPRGLSGRGQAHDDSPQLAPAKSCLDVPKQVAPQMLMSMHNKAD